MNKDSITLTKIFNLADELGLYCSMTKGSGEVLNMFVGEKTFFTSDCINNYIHDSDRNKYTYRDLKKYVYKCKELDKLTRVYLIMSQMAMLFIFKLVA